MSSQYYPHNDKPLKVTPIKKCMDQKYRTIIIVTILLGIIGAGVYVRSSYIRTEGKYILAFDPYYHYRMAETILEEGSRPDWDYIAAYPTGSPVKHPPLFHYYLAYSYKVIALFSGVTLFQWCIYANIIPVILAILAAYYAGKAVTNEIGGLFTALFAAVSGATSSRTVIGYTDTDIFVVLFSFVVTYFFVSALKNEKKYSSPLLGITLFLFAVTWTGYWHLVFLVFSAFIIYLAVDAVRRKAGKDLWSAFAVSLLCFALPWTLYNQYYAEAAVLAVLGVIWYLRGNVLSRYDRWVLPVVGAVAAVISITVLRSERIFSFAFRNSERLLGLSLPSAGGPTLPDISMSILQRGAVTFTAMSQLFSMLMVVAPFGIVFLIWRRTRISLQVLVYLVLYFVGTGLMMLLGGRYTMIFAVPLILASGAFFGILPDILEGRVTSKGICAVILVCALSVVPVYVGSAETSKAVSSMNDDLWEALTWINANTPEDSVVISGWDTGYWVESIAKRRSVMNGSHYDIYWRVVKHGKLLETTDEDVAVKEIYGFSDRSEVEALREFPENSDTLIQKEMSGFAEDNAYILVSEWTILTFYWLSYFGNWNYVTGEGEGRIYNPLWIQDARKLISTTEYIYGDESISFSVIKENDYFHSFIFDQSGYVSTMGTLFLKDRYTYCLQRAEGDLGVIYVPPRSVSYFGTELELKGAPAEVFLINEKDLACMLTRLYFFNGEGLHYFELVKDCGTAKVYKVHKTAQEFDQGVITEIDTFVPA